MKCIICEVCGDYIPHGAVVWSLDSVFEQEQNVCCQKCAELYNGYPEALKRLQGDEYKGLKWVEVVSDWRNKDSLKKVQMMNIEQIAQREKDTARALYIQILAGHVDGYAFQLIDELRQILNEIERKLSNQQLCGKSDLKGLAMRENI